MHAWTSRLMFFSVCSQYLHRKRRQSLIQALDNIKSGDFGDSQFKIPQCTLTCISILDPRADGIYWKF